MVTINPSGEIFVNAGCVLDLTTGTTTIYNVGSGIAVESYNPTPLIRIGRRYDQAFVGGTGTSMEMDGSVTGTLAPIGYFRQIKRYEWEDKYGNKIVFDPDTGDAVLSDTNDEIATFSDVTATTAPVGAFTATTYGEDTYNGGSAFTITSTYEANPNTTPDVFVNNNENAEISGFYVHSANWGEWLSEYVEVDSATFAPLGKFKIIQDESGLVQLTDSTNTIAEATAASAIDPSVELILTTYGSQSYFNGISNPIIYVNRAFVTPIEGYVWIELELSSGSLVGASGPFFGASLPANSSTLEVVPIAYSDGQNGLQQIHEGPIHWR